jgi:hypothetical protein
MAGRTALTIRSWLATHRRQNPGTGVLEPLSGVEGLHQDGPIPFHDIQALDERHRRAIGHIGGRTAAIGADAKERFVPDMAHPQSVLDHR